MRFRDRADAGRALADALGTWRGRDAVVLGLPRGGVPVAHTVATRLGLPLDVVIVRKLGVPFQPELAMGALGEDGVRILNEGVIAQCHVTALDLAAAETRERAALEARAEQFRAIRRREPLTDRTAIIIDDGIATGATVAAACAVVRAQGARYVVVASPVAAPGSVARLHTAADEVVVVQTPSDFSAVGQFYEHFDATTDAEVCHLLEHAAVIVDSDTTIDLADVGLPAHLTVPPSASGVVIFAHGSGSGRHSPRNRHVAEQLQHAGFATLLLDLLLASEEHSRPRVFDVDLLATRLSGAVAWSQHQELLRGLPVFLFGAATGSAAALIAAAHHGSTIAGVVSRSGRPDLAGDALANVQCPCLLIVGGADDDVVEHNHRALAQLGADCELAIVPGATHLFPEPGALDRVAELARDWCTSHLPQRVTV